MSPVTAPALVGFSASRLQTRSPGWFGLYRGSLAFGAAVHLGLLPHTASRRQLWRLPMAVIACSCLRLALTANSPRKGLSLPIHCPCQAHPARDLLTLEPGAIYVIDRGYVNFARLHAMHQTGAFFVTGANSNMNFHRRYSAPTDRTTGVVCDQTIALNGHYARSIIRGVCGASASRNAETSKTLVFLTNNFNLPALTIAALYKKRQQPELFFKWIKQSYGTSENAVKTQIRIAVSVYVLVAIVKKRLGLEASLDRLMQLLSVTIFEKMPLQTALSSDESKGDTSMDYNQLNLFMFLPDASVAKSMIERGGGGAIINIISAAGHQGEPGNIAYNTAKCGLINFTRSTAVELVRFDIRVNSLTPTATDPGELSDRTKRWGCEVFRPQGLGASMEPFRTLVLIQKFPVPSDYGHAAVFLASDRAAMIAGTDLRVDAGAIARYWAWDPSKRG
jgi:NAD(P)-dependent dehydrogenase (short-subunit alcohol dehydrogenase family)